MVSGTLVVVAAVVTGAEELSLSSGIYAVEHYRRYDSEYNNKAPPSPASN
ncbi:MAG: hypothetical protein ACLS48_05790 [[Eubacterium] siraeum]